MLKIGKKGIAVLFLLVTVLISADLLIGQFFVDHFLKRQYGAPNIVLLLIGLTAVALLTGMAFLLHRYCGDVWAYITRRKTVLFLSCVLFAVQLYVGKNILLASGWDVEVVVTAARGLLQGQPIQQWYYGAYPNNLFITLLYALIIKINETVGVCAQDIYAIVIVQSIFSATAAYLVYSVTREVTKSSSAAFGAFGLYVLLVGISPWFVITYSDPAGILFPILIFRMYQLAKGPRKPWVKFVLYAVLGVTAFIGYKIKPQILVVSIAILIAEAAKIFGALFTNKKAVLKKLACVLLGVVVFVCGSQLYGRAVRLIPGVELSKEAEFGMSHFLMLGLCEDTDGVYSESDVQLSFSFDTKAERTAAHLQEVRNRLQQMGITGYIRHLTQKTLVNFGDGTFTWGQEGHFFKTILPEPNSVVAPALRSVYYEGGAYYTSFITFMQCVWVTVFVLSILSVAAVFRKRGNGSGDVAVLQLSLLGLTAFVTLFESRTRYLFTYAPLFVVCAAIGLAAVLGFMRAKRVE